MNKLLLSAGLLAAGFLSTASAAINNSDLDKPLTIAVIGDWPYGKVLFDNANLLINSINADADVKLVLHVGDIHSGSQPCTGAGLNPLPVGSLPGYNQSVYGLFQQFSDPLVYTPGDNEWADCHKTKELKSGDPLKELASVRSLFFARPGHTLGLTDKAVKTQAKSSVVADRQFVENVMWEQKDVVFVTFNVPGSNNDTLPWTGVFANPVAQAAEVAARSAANLRWLEKAFSEAEEESAKGIVIGLQADMWDPAAIGGDGLDQYTAFVQKLADLSVHFARPVLLINGDSHVFGSDQPLADPSSTTGNIHHTQAVANLTRITVQGSTTAPAEWLRLTIDPNSAQVFSWQNVPYCADPLIGPC
jgi:hypothetical protein